MPSPPPNRTPAQYALKSAPQARRITAIFSRGDIGGGDAPGGEVACCPVAPGGGVAAPPEAALTAVWQGDDSSLRWLWRHCRDAAPPVGTPEQ
jgi:hypothetical protein